MRRERVSLCGVHSHHASEVVGCCGCSKGHSSAGGSGSCLRVRLSDGKAQGTTRASGPVLNGLGIDN
eukprot:12886192-Prorocentrum_lima.AAC.1